MSAEFACKGEKPRRLYWFSDAHCIEATCWAPGMSTCLNRAYHGCPTNRGYDLELAKKRKAEGWKCVKKSVE
jgi:hypothetical protein